MNFTYYPSSDPNDKIAKARFFDKDVLIPNKSQADKPYYQKRTYIEISIPGSNDMACQPASEKDYRRFEIAYRAYKGEAIKLYNGTPIEDLEGMIPDVALALRGKGVHTIEDLANMPDGLMPGLGRDAWQHRVKARAKTNWTDNTPAKAEPQDDTKALIEALQKQVAELQAKPEEERKVLRLNRKAAGEPA